MSTYADRHCDRMDTFHADLWRQPELIVSLPDDLATTVLEYLLSMACESQHITNISIGRRAFAAMPSDWLSHCIHSVAERKLNLSDDWECRRLIELYSLVDKSLALRFAEYCVESSNPEIAKAGQDFIDNPDGMSETARQSLGQPLP